MGSFSSTYFKVIAKRAAFREIPSFIPQLVDHPLVLSFLKSLVWGASSRLDDCLEDLSPPSSNLSMGLAIIAFLT